jgi:hypothetical protein
MNILTLTGGFKSTKQISILLQKTKLWSHGSVYINGTIYTKIVPDIDNNIKVIKNYSQYCESMPTLIVNDMIYYQNKYLFNYNVILYNCNNIEMIHDTILYYDTKIHDTNTFYDNTRN